MIHSDQPMAQFTHRLAELAENPDRHPHAPPSALFDALGFRWDGSAIPSGIATHSIERVCFRCHKMLPEFVWDAAVLEGNPFTFPEVQTVLAGVTVGGRKISDQTQVLNLAESAKRLLAMVKAGQFALSKPVFTELNSIVARQEALEWGVFRGEGQETNYTSNVGLGEHGRYTPLPTLPKAPELNRVFSAGAAALHACKPFERATAFFLFGALQQFFFDGNKRTSRFMMNGVLMSHGIDAISVPAAKAQEFNEKMVRFYLSKDATEMMAFLAGCHPDTKAILVTPEEKPSGVSELKPWGGWLTVDSFPGLRRGFPRNAEVELPPYGKITLRSVEGFPHLRNIGHLTPFEPKGSICKSVWQNCYGNAEGTRKNNRKANQDDKSSGMGHLLAQFTCRRRARNRRTARHGR